MPADQLSQRQQFRLCGITHSSLPGNDPKIMCGFRLVHANAQKHGR